VPGQFRGTLENKTPENLFSTVHESGRSSLDSVTVLPCWYLEPLCDVKIVLARLHIPVCVIYIYIRLQCKQKWMNTTNARKYGGGPITQLFPAPNASSAALTHFGREPSVSWFTYTYSAGAKCVRKNVDFPRPGRPTKRTISV
jgi:hypothetical protein